MNTAFKAALISAALAAVAAPAFAQDFGHRGPDNRGHDNRDYGQTESFARVGFDLFQRIDRLEDRIDRARDHRNISRQEARRATRELRDIREELTRATRGRYSLSPFQHARFEQRIDRVGGYIRNARDDDRYGPRQYRG